MCTASRVETAQALAQSILAHAPLPAMRHLRRLLALFVFSALPLSGQQGRITADTDVRAAPGGVVVADLRAGTVWETGARRAGFTSVVITAWVDNSRFGAARDSFPTTIGGSQTLRIREAPSLQGRILGNFRAGAGLRVLERRATWSRIRREVWVPNAAIALTAAPSAAPSAATTTPNRPANPSAARATAAPAPTAGTPGAPAESPTVATAPPTGSAPTAAGVLRAQSEVSLHLGIGGPTIGQLAPGAVVSPRARERGWVKVQVDAWVPESLFVPADTAYGALLTAADLRADPEGHRGKLVRWEVQVIGMQLADPLRRDMTEDEPFLLAMGPTGENATIYVTVPQGLIAESRAIPPLARIILTARIRTGRSNPTGAPILELISFVRK